MQGGNMNEIKYVIYKIAHKTTNPFKTILKYFILTTFSMYFYTYNCV